MNTLCTYVILSHLRSKKIENIHITCSTVIMSENEMEGVPNFGREKTLANLANHHNSPSFFANIPDEARSHAVCVVNVRHMK